MNPPLEDETGLIGRRKRLVSERTRSQILISICMVLPIVIVVPLVLGIPSLSAAGVVILLGLVLSLRSVDDQQNGFRRGVHMVYFGGLLAVAYGVFGLELPSVIAVYFPSIILLSAAHILGSRAALLWSVPSLALMAVATLQPDPVEREVSAAVILAVRMATMTTILAYAVSFRRSQDRQGIELELYATTDSLSGLANRHVLKRAFDQTLARTLRHHRHGALLFIDLDGLKSINDDYGHRAGDEMIRTVAARILGATRASDTAVRLGGDEFVVLISDINDRKDAERVAQKLLSEIAAPCEIGGQVIRPSASVGVVVFPEAGDRPDDLLLLADQAMYQAKRAGGDRIAMWDDDDLQKEV